MASRHLRKTAAMAATTNGTIATPAYCTPTIGDSSASGRSLIGAEHPRSVDDTSPSRTRSTQTHDDAERDEPGDGPGAHDWSSRRHRSRELLGAATAGFGSVSVDGWDDRARRDRRLRSRPRSVAQPCSPASWVGGRDRATTCPRWRSAAFVAANGLPTALWPLVWAPVQAGSLVGSLASSPRRAAVTRRKRLTAATLLARAGRVLGGEGREAPRRPGTARAVARRRRGARAGDRPRVRVGALGGRVRAGHRARAGAPRARGASCRSRSRPSWRSAACTRARTCRSTSSAAIGLGLLAGTAARWAARPRCVPPARHHLDEVPPLEVVEAEPARAGPAAST